MNVSKGRLSPAKHGRNGPARARLVAREHWRSLLENACADSDGSCIVRKLSSAAVRWRAPIDNSTRGNRNQRITSVLVCDRRQLVAQLPQPPVSLGPLSRHSRYTERFFRTDGATSSTTPSGRRLHLAETRPSIPGSDHWLTRTGLFLYIMRWLVWYMAGRVRVCPGTGSVAAREPLGRSRCSSTVGMLSTTTVRCRACPSDSPASLCCGSALSACLACLLAGARTYTG